MEQSANEPIRFSIDGWHPKQHLAEKREGNPRAFARGWQQKAIQDDELTFPSFATCLHFGNPLDFVKDDWLRYTGVDLSGKRRPGNVIVTIALEPVTRLRVPLDVRRGAWSSPETAKQILAVVRTFHPQRVMVENNGYQEALEDWMKSGGDNPHDIPLEPFTTGQNKWAEDTGVTSLEVEFSRRSWQIYRPNDGIDCKCDWCVWIDEFKGHPTASTTDGVMATWFAREAANRGLRSKLDDLRDTQGKTSESVVAPAMRAFSTDDDSDDIGDDIGGAMRAFG